MIWLFATLALAASPCERQWSAPTSRVSVAYVGQARAVGPYAKLAVIPTSELRLWVERETDPTVGRLLQYLGLQKRSRMPTKAWNITIFDVEKDQLCRTVSNWNGSNAGGLSVCDNPPRGKMKRNECGVSIDQQDGKPSLQSMQVVWSEAAERGYCVLPAQRFVDDLKRNRQR